MEAGRWLNLRAGRYVTPWGIRNVEHFHPLFLVNSSPLFLRNPTLNVSPSGASPIIASSMNGGEVNGRFLLGANMLNYSMYAGSSLAPDMDFNRLENIVFGGRLAYTFFDDQLTFGANYQHGRRGNVVSVTTDHHGRAAFVEKEYDAWGLDLKAQVGDFGLKAEFIKSIVDNGADQIGGYIQPSYSLSDQFPFFYRFDYVDLNDNISGMPDFTERQEHIFGLNYFPHPLFRIRGEFILSNSNADRDPPFFDDPGDPDYEAVNISATMSF